MFKQLTIITVFLLLGLNASAEQFVTQGDYAIHYNAISTGLLQPDVARSYNIQRSKQRALLNISVLKKVMGTIGTPVEATVTATATNLSNQQREIPMRRIREQGAIYYIGELRISDKETLNFDVTVQPGSVGETKTFRFTQQFFVD